MEWGRSEDRMSEDAIELVLGQGQVDIQIIFILRAMFSCGQVCFDNIIGHGLYLIRWDNSAQEIIELGG